jgi:hypothetical protein
MSEEKIEKSKLFNAKYEINNYQYKMKGRKGGK